MQPKMMRNIFYFIMLALLISAVSCRQGGSSGGTEAADGQDTIKADIKALSKSIEADTANAILYQQRALLYLEERNSNQAMRDT
jgi:hypothetical protein